MNSGSARNNETRFSIIIPTKNRPLLVKYAINSVVLQDYHNYEIIVVDNSDDEETKEIVSQFSNPDIFYYKTGNLSMQENWEQGYSKITGEYSFLLRDKVALKKNSLQYIDNFLRNNNNPPWISWRYDCLNPINGEVTSYCSNDHSSILFSPQKIIDSFVNVDVSSFFGPYLWPQCGAIRSDIIAQIKEQKPGRLWFGAVGDIGFIYQLVLQNITLTHMNVALMVILHPMYSVGVIGVEYVMRGKEAERYLNANGYSLKDTYAYMPLKIFTNFNSTYNDIISIEEIRGVHQIKQGLNLRKYYSLIYDEIIQALFIGSAEKEELLYIESEISKNDPELMEQLKQEYQRARIQLPFLTRYTRPLIKRQVFFPSQIINRIKWFFNIITPLPGNKKLNVIKVLIFSTVLHNKKPLMNVYSGNALHYLESDKNTVPEKN